MTSWNTEFIGVGGNQSKEVEVYLALLKKTMKVNSLRYNILQK